MSKLRVLQILPELHSGGVERGTIEIVKALVSDKQEAFVCSNGGALVDDIEKLGATHFKIPVHSKNPLIMLLNVFRLIKVIKENDVNIVHARSRAPAWSSYLACKLTGCKFITTFHGAYGSSNALKRLYNSVMLRSDKIIAISNFILKHVETRYRVAHDDIEVIHRGVDLDYFNPAKVSDKRVKDLKKELEIDTKKPVIIMPARFTRLKGHLYLLKALRYLKGKNFNCYIVGNVSVKHYEYREEIGAKIAKYGLKDQVFVKPQVNDMPALYKLADIVVSASTQPEAFGRTLVEAQAMGKIVIATAHGGALEIIEDGKTGFHVANTDPSSLTETIEKVLAMGDKDKAKFAKAAEKNVKDNFTLDQMCKKVIKLYKELLK